MGKLHAQSPDWKFWVLEKGVRKKNKCPCERNNLDRIHFGRVNPNEYYKKIFHMTSAFEGFECFDRSPSYGFVFRLFNSYSAASDIVNHNKNGILIQPFDCNEYMVEKQKFDGY